MWNKIKPYVLAFLTIIAFFAEYESIYNGKIFKATNPFPFCIGIVPLSICYILILNMYKKENTKLESIGMKLLSILFSFLMVMGNSYIKVLSSKLVFGNPLMIFISILAFFGYLPVISIILNKTIKYIDSDKLKKKENKISNKIKLLLDNKPFIFSFCFIICAWLIYIIAFYPIVMSPDPTTQVMQFYNLDNKYANSVILLNNSVKLTNHHPVLYTIFLGTCTLIGNKIGNGNLGLFIYSFIQIIFMAATFAYSIKYMKKLNTPYYLRMIILCIYAFVPMYPFFSMAAVKDTLYTGFIFWYSLLIFDQIKFYKDKKMDLKRLLLFILFSLLITLYRNNGIFVIVLSLPFLMLNNKKNFLKLFIIFISIIGFNYSYKNIILPHFNITGGSIREALSIPFQQTARLVKYHEDELSEEDKKTIDKLLDIKTLGTRYKPYFADSVKDQYNKNTTDEELKDYFKLWGKLLLKYPGVYMEATVNNVYGYFYPNSIRWYLYYKYEGEVKDMGLVNFHFNNLGVLRGLLSAIGASFPYFPVIGFLSNVGFSTWCVLFMCIYLIDKKKKNYMVSLSPMLISILICIAAPVNTYFRYAMPFVFLIPFFTAIIYYAGHENS